MFLETGLQVTPAIDVICIGRDELCGTMSKEWGFVCNICMTNRLKKRPETMCDGTMLPLLCGLYSPLEAFPG